MTNKDLQLIRSIKKQVKVLIPELKKEIKEFDKRKIEHPLDEEILKKLDNFKLREDDDDYRIFYYVNEIKDVWKLIIEKSIKCLRFFDEREPFMCNDSKKPVAYGVKELSEYFDKYTEFETMLYGGEKYYRDHVIHVFRVWLLGLDCLLDNNAEYLKHINIYEGIEINSLEKISIWSMISLTHDLGYPLEKSQEIIEKTKEMMKSFVSNPMISLNLSFDGVQNNMNDFVIRFISSKMRRCSMSEKDVKEKYGKEYVARLQPKYYFKFQKSLERYRHGILSAIIIYKLLIYFLESDFNINEDYRFDKEEARQFYIRREILRAIAAHTCNDVYHLDMFNFAFLLIMVDDAQEWGRKRISELYVKKDSNYEFESITPYFNFNSSTEDGKIQVHKFVMKEQFEFPEDELDNLCGILTKLMKQRDVYLEIFRDGQDTARRNFIFQKNCEIIYYDDSKKVKFNVIFVISNEEKPTFEITVESTNKDAIKKKFDQKFFEKLYTDSCIECKETGADKKIYEICLKEELD